jgi:hypothetical protein
MDESKNPIPPNELDPWSALDRTSAVADALPAELARSRERAAPGRRRHSDQSELCRDDLPDGPSVVVYCGNEEEVSRGFLIALRAMGVAAVEQPPGPAKPHVARAKP